jgi:WD40 repeat protein
MKKTFSLIPIAVLCLLGGDKGGFAQYNAPTPSPGKEPQLLKGHTLPVTALVFAPGSKLLASGSAGKTVVLWDTLSGKQKADLVHPSNVTGLAFTADGKTLAVGQFDKTLTLWNVPAGTRRVSFKVPAEDTNVRGIDLAPDGGLLAAKCPFHVSIWDVAKERESATVAQNNSYWDESGNVAFSPDGATLAIPWVGEDIVLWDRATAKERRLKGHGRAVIYVTFSADGKLLASGSDDGTVKVWDLAQGEVVANLRGYEAPVWWVEFSQDGKRLLTWSGRDGRLRREATVGTAELWDLAAREELAVVKKLPAVRWCRLSPDNNTLAISFYDDFPKKWCVKLLDVATGAERALYKEDKGPPTLLAFSGDGKLLAWANPDGTVRLWEVAR